jgi:small subunit ribosomal protein S16
MVTLRLARAGTKKRPVYHLVATDSRSRRDGAFLEKLGYFIPGPDTLVLKSDRVDYWLKVGALPSETVAHLIKISKKQAPAAASA